MDGARFCEGLKRDVKTVFDDARMCDADPKQFEVLVDMIVESFLENDESVAALNDRGLYAEFLEILEERAGLILEGYVSGDRARLTQEIHQVLHATLAKPEGFFDGAMQVEEHDWLRKDCPASELGSSSSVLVKYFINASEYWRSLYDDLKEAKQTILVTGWDFNDKLVLVPGESQPLDQVLRLLLQTKKELVIVLALWEDAFVKPQTLGCNDGNRVAGCFKRLNDLKTTFSDRFWLCATKGAGGYVYSHHQKTVVIDRKIGYCGGIDLAVGRWDDFTHMVFPRHEWAGNKDSDWYNPSSHHRPDGHRQPWRDIACRVVGGVVSSLFSNIEDRIRASRNGQYILGPNVLGRTIESPSNAHECEGPGELQTTATFIRSYPEKSDWNSMLMAYLNAISNAKHFIYVENQFFISWSRGWSDEDYASLRVSHAKENLVLNPVAKYLVDAARRKIQVFVTLPMHPETTSAAMEPVARYLFRLQWLTISYMYRELEKCSTCSQKDCNCHDRIDHTRYLQIFCLVSSSHGIQNMVYVHSKLLIIDDDIAIVGSANINDRSLIGRRDTECGILFRGKSVAKFRQRVFRSFLPEEVHNKDEIIVVRSETGDVLRKVAEASWELYKKTQIPSGRASLMSHPLHFELDTRRFAMRPFFRNTLVSPKEFEDLHDIWSYEVPDVRLLI